MHCSLGLIWLKVKNDIHWLKFVSVVLTSVALMHCSLGLIWLKVKNDIHWLKFVSVVLSWVACILLRVPTSSKSWNEYDLLLYYMCLHLLNLGTRMICRFITCAS
jgi:hypothetical protein